MKIEKILVLDKIVCEYKNGIFNFYVFDLIGNQLVSGKKYDAEKRKLKNELKQLLLYELTSQNLF